ncbi:YbfB/YjiJ family MFS transporter [Congregibacter brevis]|uniref:YbfB/YjiJ family MFS transporter n=1 Tax=Congregibacter brevis TaxID=3081201 RepID=A0ABZ0I8F4_9GAMM|nr:YbfB/YjiJ family MFS transporter [Congregibacter sp. IMCC45268]
MIDDTPSESVFDCWQSLAAGLYLSIVGYSVLAGVPVISTAWSELLGFSEVQVGRVAGADLGGLSVGAMLAALLVARVDRRWLLVWAILAAILANLACVYWQSYTATLGLRFFAGMASGVVTGIAVATLGGRQRAARAFNYLLFSFAFVQAGELYLLPRLAMEDIYKLFAMSYLPALLFLLWIPARPAPVLSSMLKAHSPLSVRGDKVPPIVPWLCLAAMALTYVNIGAYWTYIELASADAGLDEEWVSNVLIWVSFFSVLGCLFATLLSDRFGLARPLLATLLLHAATAGMLIAGINEPRFFISLYAFNFLWIFVDVYQMGSVANVDGNGRFASLMPAAQGLGQIVGPNLAASLLALGAGYSGIFFMCALASLAAFAVYALAYQRLSQSAMGGNHGFHGEKS